MIVILMATGAVTAAQAGAPGGIDPQRWAVFAVRAVGTPPQALREHAAKDALSLALWLELDRTAAQTWIVETLATKSRRRALALLDVLSEVEKLGSKYFIELPGSYRSFEERVLAGRLDGMVLARIGATLPGLNTTRIASAACKRLKDVVHLNELAREPGALERFTRAFSFLEAAAYDRFVPVLRVIGRSRSNTVSALGNWAALGVGDAASAEHLWRWVRNGEADDYLRNVFQRDAASLYGEPARYRLARLGSSTIGAGLRRETEENGDFAVENREPSPSLVALAIGQGVPRETARTILRRPERASEAERKRTGRRRRAVFEGEASVAVLDYLALEPRSLPADLWRLDDERVRSALRGLRTSRGTGVYAEATIMLACLGDAACRAEAIVIIEQGQYRGTGAILADPRVALLGGRPAELLPFWIKAFESRRRRPLAETVLAGLFGLSLETRHELTERPERRLGRWWRRHASDAFRWSSLSCRFIPVHENGTIER